MLYVYDIAGQGYDIVSFRISYFGFWISSVWTTFCCQFGHVNADIFSGIFMSNNDDMNFVSIFLGLVM